MDDQLTDATKPRNWLIKEAVYPVQHLHMLLEFGRACNFDKPPSSPLFSPSSSFSLLPPWNLRLGHRLIPITEHSFAAPLFGSWEEIVSKLPNSGGLWDFYVLLIHVLDILNRVRNYGYLLLILPGRCKFSQNVTLDCAFRSNSKTKRSDSRLVEMHEHLAIKCWW